MKSLCCEMMLFMLAMVLLGACARHDDDDVETTTSSTLQRWQQCDVFLAPSGWMNGGFGVFANRPFQKDEIIELAPLFLSFSYGSPVVSNSALRDFVYGYVRADDPNDPSSFTTMGTVVMGNTMILNHHPQAPNVAWGFGNFGSAGHDPDSAQSVGFAARRDIHAGEELFSSYGEEDGGKEWFRIRNLPLMEVPKEGLLMNETDLADMSQQFCSKIYAGIGLPSWNPRVMLKHPANKVTFTFETSRLAPFDAGLYGAVAKVDVKKGDILETAPALALLKEQVDGSALAPLVFAWNDLQPSHQSILRQVHSMGGLFVQHQGEDTGWQRQDRFQGFQQLVIFAASGSITSVRRVGREQEETGEAANCRLEILPSGMDDGNAGIVLQLVATKDIPSGAVLKLNLRSSSASEEEMSLLRAEMMRTKQPMSLMTTDCVDSSGVSEGKSCPADE